MPPHSIELLQPSEKQLQIMQRVQCNEGVWFGTATATLGHVVITAKLHLRTLLKKRGTAANKHTLSGLDSITLNTKALPWRVNCRNQNGTGKDKF